MDFLYMILIGGLAGALAKGLTPGTAKEPSGCLLTIALGVAGSLIVGFIMRTFLGTSGGGGLIGTLVGATIGAVLLILAMRKFWK